MTMSTGRSRYAMYGARLREFREKPYLDLVSSDTWTEFITEGYDSLQYKLAVVPAAMEFRPDMISNFVYGNPSLWWLICSANAIIDPNTELYSGKQIKIPIIS